MNVTAYDIANRFCGTKEASGIVDNPLIMAMLKLDNDWPQHDEVPWCSAFVNFIAWLLGLQRSRSLMARSWLRVGQPTELIDAHRGFDVVVLRRGNPPQPGPEVLNAQGHVGLFAGLYGDYVSVLGGNQGDEVCHRNYDIGDILGIRRLYL
jgi:uncharacterized protein (TIGR02594 family)